MDSSSIIVTPAPSEFVKTLRTIKVLWQHLFKKWWWFLLAGIIGGAIGIYYAYTQKPRYESRLTFALDEGSSGGGLSGAAALAAQFGLLSGGSSDVFAGDNIIEIMRSRRIVETILLSVDSSQKKPVTMIEWFFDFTNRREKMDKHPYLNQVHFPPGQAKSNFTRLQDSVLFTIYDEFAKNKLFISRPDRKLNIVEVKVQSENEEFTKKFTDKLVAEANRFYTEIRSKKSLQTLAILEERIGMLKGGLNQSISTRAATQDANVNAAYAQAQAPLQKQQVNIQVYSAAYAEMFKNLEVAQFQYLNVTPLMQIIDPADYPMKKIKKGKLMTGILGGVVAGILMLMLLVSHFYYLQIKAKLSNPQTF